MSSPVQRRGGCGHVMAQFDQHSYCALCREKNKGKDHCVESKHTTICKFCLALTPEQIAQIFTPSYKLKKEKHEAPKKNLKLPPPLKKRLHLWTLLTCQHLSKPHGDRPGSAIATDTGSHSLHRHRKDSASRGRIHES